MKRTKRILSLVIVMSMVIQPLSVKEARAGDRNKYKKEYIVVTKTKSASDIIGEQYKGEPLELKESIKICDLTQEEAEKIENKSGIESVEPNVIVEGSGDSITTESMSNYAEWNIQMIHAGANSKEQVNEQTTEKVKVAIIDSGVNYHSDIDVKLRKNLVEGQDDISILYEDFSGHGTAIAYYSRENRGWFPKWY